MCCPSNRIWGSLMSSMRTIACESEFFSSSKRRSRVYSLWCGILLKISNTTFPNMVCPQLFIPLKTDVHPSVTLWTNHPPHHSSSILAKERVSNHRSTAIMWAIPPHPRDPSIILAPQLHIDLYFYLFGSLCCNQPLLQPSLITSRKKEIALSHKALAIILWATSPCFLCFLVNPGCICGVHLENRWVSQSEVQATGPSNSLFLDLNPWQAAYIVRWQVESAEAPHSL